MRNLVLDKCPSRDRAKMQARKSWFNDSPVGNQVALAESLGKTPRSASVFATTQCEVELRGQRAVPLAFYLGKESSMRRKCSPVTGMNGSSR